MYIHMQLMKQYNCRKEAISSARVLEIFVFSCARKYNALHGSYMSYLMSKKKYKFIIYYIYNL
jgi:hypothetical protein